MIECPLAEASLDDHRVRDPILSLLGYQLSHQPPEVVGEKRIDLSVCEAKGLSINHLHVDEASRCEFLDEVTLRQGARHSAGPRRRVR
jgi:hypothetical protein